MNMDRVLLLFCFLFTMNTAFADETPAGTPKTLFGNWGGYRDDLTEEGVDLAIVYKGEFSKAFKRGLTQRTSYIENLDVKLTLDADKLISLKDTTFFLYGLGNHGSENGNSPSNNVGDHQGTSNIEARVDDFKLYEAWVQKEFFDKKLSVLFGLHDLNSEFYVTNSSGLFLNSSFGAGKELSQTGVNGPSVFPAAAPALRVKTQQDDFYLQAALFNAQAGDPDSPKGTQFRMGGSDGTLAIAELALTGSGKLALGAWSYNRTFDHISDPIQVNNSGYYFLIDKNISDNTSAFLRYGVASNGPNEVGTCVTGGLVTTGLIPLRPNDRFGFGFASVTPSEVYKTSSEALGNQVSTETTFELSYRIEVYPGIALQPDFQYVTRPSMDETARGVHVGSFRIELNF